METIQENNKLIAEFMGHNVVEQNELTIQDISITRLAFHSDWNWLMQVVEEIETTKVNNINYIDFHIMPDAVIVTNQDDEETPLILINKSEGYGSIEIEPILFTTKIEAVYNACIAFIKWYNGQTA